jgi:oxygen-independent coproporphyrinogen-3 oxidase
VAEDARSVITAPIRIHRPGTVSLAALPPLALYVHLPWCLKKCPYCDFNSHEILTPKTPSTSPPTGHEGDPAGPGGASGSGRPGAGRASSFDEKRYLDALLADLEPALPQVWGRRVSSVFIGGGTPSLFAPTSIEQLIAGIRARLPLEAGCEITLEANPGTFERTRFRAFRGAGVTRLSIGVQSFDDAMLAAIGRVHDSAQARAAVEEARAAFDTFNIDLMYALPGQSMAQLEADLDAALSFAPPHLSIYHLTIEANTAFANAPPAGLPDADLASAMLDAIVARTAAQDLERYEVSAFARKGHRCAHNLNYWQFGDYLGIGAGAHGKLSFPDRIVRQVRWREPAMYMDKALAGQALSNEHGVGAADLAFEFMLNALRLADGFELARFTERTGQPLATIEPALQRACERGLLVLGAGRAVPTPLGFDFLSDLQQMFLPPRAAKS